MEVLDNRGSYPIRTIQTNSELLMDLTMILADLLKQEKIMEIEYSGNKLMIQVQIEELHLDVINKLLKL